MTATARIPFPKSALPVVGNWLPSETGLVLDLAGMLSHGEKQRAREDANRCGPFHRDGTWWYDAKLPRRWHKCQPQTIGLIGGSSIVERCACGGVRYHGDTFWIERNNRRRDERRTPKR